MKEAGFSSIPPIDRTLIRCYHTGPEWTWERWPWRGTPHSPKLQPCWNLTMGLFSVISGHSLGGGLSLLQRSSRSILQPQPTGQSLFRIRSFIYIACIFWTSCMWITYNQRPSGHIWWCNGWQALLAKRHEWVQVSLGAPFVWPCTTSKQRSS